MNLQPTSITLRLRERIHVGPATLLLQLLAKHSGVELTVSKESPAQPTVIQASIFQVLGLALSPGEKVTFAARGSGAEMVLDAIRAYNNLGWKTSSSAAFRKAEIFDVPYQEDLHTVIRHIITLMDTWKVDNLSGIYHYGSNRLVVGKPTDPHEAIAAAMGITDANDITRINFERSQGRLSCAFSTEFQNESVAGYGILKKHLEALFQWVPCP